MLSNSASNQCDREPSSPIYGRNLLIIAVWHLLIGCSFLAIRPCDANRFCKVISGVYVVGGTESQLISLRESLSETSLSFQSWSGTVAPAGVVRLDKRLPLSGLISHVKWSFTYDKDRAPHFRITTGSRVVEGLSPQDRTLDLRSQGRQLDNYVISHEICHKYASYLSHETWGEDHGIPDAISEISAISCEPNSIIRFRVDSFAPLYRKGGRIPWNTFLEADHPMKKPALIEKIKYLGKKTSSNHMVFSFERNSDLGLKVDSFYGQAAAMALFLKSRTCGRYSGVGWLIKRYNPRLGFSHWLSTNKCLPQNSEEFDKAIASIIVPYADTYI
jgi:hypothetical protein